MDVAHFFLSVKKRNKKKINKVHSKAIEHMMCETPFTVIPRELWFEHIIPRLSTVEAICLWSTSKLFYYSSSLSKRFEALRYETLPVKSNIQIWRRDLENGRILANILYKDSVELFHLFIMKKPYATMLCSDIYERKAFKIMEAILCEMPNREVGIWPGETLRCAINNDDVQLYDICMKYPSEAKFALRDDIFEGAKKFKRKACVKRMLKLRES